MASEPPTMAPNNIRGSLATIKISRSGLTPATTFRQVTPAVPIHGVTSKTIKQNAAQGATIAKNRPAESPLLCGGYDVGATAVGPLEDSGVDFEDVIKMLRCKDLVGRPVGGELAVPHRDHAASITRCEINIVRHADDRHSAFRI